MTFYTTCHACEVAEGFVRGLVERKLACMMHNGSLPGKNPFTGEEGFETKRYGTKYQIFVNTDDVTPIPVNVRFFYDKDTERSSIKITTKGILTLFKAATFWSLVGGLGNDLMKAGIPLDSEWFRQEVKKFGEQVKQKKIDAMATIDVVPKGGK